MSNILVHIMHKMKEQVCLLVGVCRPWWECEREININDANWKQLFWEFYWVALVERNSPVIRKGRHNCSMDCVDLHATSSQHRKTQTVRTDETCKRPDRHIVGTLWEVIADVLRSTTLKTYYPIHIQKVNFKMMLNNLKMLFLLLRMLWQLKCP